MNAFVAPPGYRFREFRWEDLPALTGLFNLIYPDEPVTLAQMEHWERTYPADNPRLRYVVEVEGGGPMGLGSCERPIWAKAVGVYNVYAAIHPAHRGRGLGRGLLAALEPFGWAQGATRLWTDCREDFAETIRFLERAGFTQFGIRFESRLDLTIFDETPFAGVFDRIVAAGYVLTTLAEERKLRPDADERAYELHSAVVADVPLPGGARIEQSYQQFRDQTLDAPNSDPAAFFIAKLGDEYVGLTALELLRDGPAITASTGVRREHRSRGLALALKLASFRFLRSRGYAETRAHNDTANPPILRLNESLGYQRLPGWLQWEKVGG
jgi:RimJ/RimL family protein N-acetyltransferase